jgi:hypothetical protein
VIAGAGARCLGHAGLGALIPRIPAFELVLSGPLPAGARPVRRVFGAALDRARFFPALPWTVFGCLVFSVLSLLLGATAQLVAAGALLFASGWAWLAGRPAKPVPGAPECRLADAMVAAARRFEARGEEGVAVVLAGGSAERGTAYAALCDWAGVARESVELVVVELPGADPDRPSTAVEALTRAGWRVTRMGLSALEEQA